MAKSVSLFQLQSSRIQNKSQLFQLLNPASLDPNKPNLLVITFNTFKDRYNHIYGFFHEILEVLKEDYNIIYTGKEILNNVKHFENFFLLSTKGYNLLNSQKFKRKKQEENNVKYNREILWQEFEKAFGDLQIDKVFYATSDYFNLPLTVYYGGEYEAMMNEFHDYVGDDKKKIQEIHQMIHDFCGKFDEKVSLLAFTMYYKNIFMNLPVFLHQKSPLQMLWAFSVDPMSFLDYFSYYGIPHKRFYFVNDKRGTRDYDEFPIAHLQHLVHENRFFPTQKIQKTKDFFFMGSIFHDKGKRRDLWYQFLHNLRLKDSSIWVPFKLNGVFKEKKDETSKYSQEGLQKIYQRYTQLVNDIKNHPLYTGHLVPQEVKKKISEYRYGLVLRCVSNHDSLNFRPLFYTYLRILPLLDPEYDPAGLQIPLEIQKELLVRDSNEIQTRVEYFNKHPEQREKILDKLHYHFKIDEFLRDWKKIIREYLK